MSETTLIGKRIPRYGSVEKSLGRARYTADIVLPNMLYGKALRSPYPHARIKNIDTSKAERLPGVKAVVYGKRDAPDQGKFGILAWSRDHLLLPIDKVRYVGEEVAAVAAIDEDIAEEAIQLIEVEYEQLPPVYDPVEALKEGAPLIHEDKEGNIAAHYFVDEGDVEEGFRQSEYVREDTFTCPTISHALPEPYAVVANYEAGKFHIWAQTQCPFQNRQGLRNALRVPLANIRLHQVWMGAAFGGRSDTCPAQFIAALLSRKAERPVKITFSREEVEDTMRDRGALIWKMKTGVKKDGAIVARKIDVIMEAGAYASSAVIALWVPLLMDEVIYRAPNYRYDGLLAYTNKTICSMMRTRSNLGPMAADSQLDMIAEDLGLDPVEIRLKNAIQPGEVTPTKSTVTSCGLSDSIKIAVEKSNWYEKRGKLGPNRGIGMGVGNMQCGFFQGFRSGSTSIIKFNDDGTCTLFTGNVDNGQGNQTMHLQVAAEELGIPMEDIHLVFGDTELCFQDPGTYSMSSTVISANATKKAAADAKQKLLQVAASMFEVSPDQVEMKDKTFYVKRRLPAKGIPLIDVCRSAFRRGAPILGFGDFRGRVDFSDFSTHLDMPYEEKTYGQKVVSYSWGTVVAEVEVDRETGRVKVLDITAVNDCGTVLNPLVVEGLMDGLLALLIGHGLFETNKWDYKTGRKLTSSYRTYKVTTVKDVPKLSNVRRYFTSTIDPEGPYGAKEPALGFGEGLNGAMVDAIHDAVGIRVKSLPINPEEVLRLLKEKEAEEQN